MSEDVPIFTGIDAAFYDGYRDGGDLSTPEAGPNQHPAYRHSWEVARAEKEGWVIPADWSRKRAAHIEAGGDFYPFPRQHPMTAHINQGEVRT